MFVQSLAETDAKRQDVIDLKIMATTDLHMHILGFDYFANRAGAGFGLARVASAIKAERAGSPNTLLFDNGDFLQGSPMGDYAAEALPGGRKHPAIDAMQALSYDAATLGNHDFSYGLRFLRRTLQDAALPFVSTNLRSRRPLPVTNHLLLERSFRDRAGQPHALRIGVLGFLPPQTLTWEPDLKPDLEIDDILTSARQGIDALRAQDADLIIALAHSGIGELAPRPLMENAATALADLPGIDIVIAGHTHRTFPCPTHPPGAGIDQHEGTLAGKPGVMAGFWGSHLGVIDLGLAPHAQGWRIARSHSRIVPVATLPEDPPLSRIAQSAHHGTLRHFSRKVGKSTVPLNSYFTLIGHDPGLRLVAMAQRWHVRKQLADTRWSGLPVLSAAAPFRAGGRSGPGQFTDVAAGPLTLRQLADLYLFPNRICALEVTGADLADWLERSASIFRQILPGHQDQQLTNPDFPGYSFDLIDGLSWQCDLSLPPGFSSSGSALADGARRVSAITHRGRPVEPSQRFVLVTNSYRLSDSGLFAAIPMRCPVILRGQAPTREILRRYVTHRRIVSPEGDLGWRFRPMPGSSVRFRTGPGAAAHLRMAGQAIEDMGVDAEGFLQLRLHL